MNLTMESLGLAAGEVWTIDPHRPNPQDVEITGSGTRKERLVIFVRSCLPGGFHQDDVRPVDALDFVRHAVRLHGATERGEYDHSHPRDAFVR